MALRLPALVCFVALVLAPGVARGQSFGVSEIKVYRLDTNTLLKDQDLKEFFNKAQCECETPLRIEVKIQGDYQNSDYDFQMVAGLGCLDSVNNTIKTEAEGCYVLKGPVKINSLQGDFDITKDPQGRTVTAKMLMGGSCSEVDLKTYNLTMFLEKDQGGDPGKWVADANKLEYIVDTKVPDSPKDTTVTAGEGQVVVSFRGHTAESPTDDSGSGGTVDKYFKGYQVLCETAAGGQALASPPAAEFHHWVNLCGSCGSNSPPPDAGTSADAALDGASAASWSTPIPTCAGDGGLEGGAPTEAGATDGGTPDGPIVDGGVADIGARDTQAQPADSGTSSESGAVSLCKRYVCSSLQKSAGSITVSGLENGVAYRFYVVTIDSARNPSAPALAGEANPVLVEDLWERYKRLGGEGEGGYCFVATAAHGSYSHPQVRVLREFRDRVLLSSELGRLFVQGYYLTSPGPAGWIARHEHARTLARGLLWPVTVAAAAHLYTTGGDKGLCVIALLLGGVLLGGIRRRRRVP